MKFRYIKFLITGVIGYAMSMAMAFNNGMMSFSTGPGKVVQAIEEILYWLFFTPGQLYAMLAGESAKNLGTVVFDYWYLGFAWQFIFALILTIITSPRNWHICSFKN